MSHWTPSLETTKPLGKCPNDWPEDWAIPVSQLGPRCIWVNQASMLKMMRDLVMVRVAPSPEFK